MGRHLGETTLPSTVGGANSEGRLPVVLLTSGPQAGAVIDLTGRPRLTFGRSVECDVTIDDPELSRCHAELAFISGSLFVRDAGSRNGTFLNGEKVDFSAALSPNDHIRLSPSTQLRVAWLEPSEFQALRSTSAAALDVHRQLRDDGESAGAARTMDVVLAQARRIAKSDLPVLLLGETGVGKDVMARALHTSSPRAAKPFVAVNCSALSDALFEAELFGHERGAFTGAERARDGLIASADGGTLFLDEVGELPRSAQAKLLRVLEDRRVTRVGADRWKEVDVRFISATNRDLRAEVERGQFRQDLLFRLNAISLTIPPLRERHNEVLRLAKTFAAEAAERLGRAPQELSAAAQKHLMGHTYPGNIRELKNVVERAVALAEGNALQPADLELERPKPHASTGGALPDALKALERERVLQALKTAGGNQSRAAEMLGMPRRTLVKRLSEWNLTRKRGG